MRLLLTTLLLTVLAGGEARSSQPSQTSPPTHGLATALYLQLGSVALDPARVYRVRDASFDRGPLHFTLRDGTIAFSTDVDGKITAAFFAGDGEVLLRPQDKVERASLSLFTGAAILEETFITGYFRFNDDTFAELEPQLRERQQGEEFVGNWNGLAGNLAEADALRLFMTFSQRLPLSEGSAPQKANGPQPRTDDRMLHARLQGAKLGYFDIYYDSLAAEQVAAGQLAKLEGVDFYNLWTSFAIPSSRSTEAGSETSGLMEDTPASDLAISRLEIQTKIRPPTSIESHATLQVSATKGGQRTLLFELSRALQVTQVLANGRPVEFIHNPAFEGSERARRGNDLVAVVLPQPLRPGQKVELSFAYSGDVLSAAGGGLLYVGDRGTWYPNRGLSVSEFDLSFQYPSEWTLVATGRLVAPVAGEAIDFLAKGAAGMKTDRWISERPIPVAGFNLGKYSRSTAHAGTTTIEAYATSSVERAFPKAPAETTSPEEFAPPAPISVLHPLSIVPPPPSPARNSQSVADRGAAAIDFFSRHFGPYPFAKLSLTQMPGAMSQGWPGLVFLSSFAFLTEQEQSQLRFTPAQKREANGLVAHETAHQWWGDLVGWRSYRDQWIMEALANYSALMLLETRDPQQFRAILETYRDALLEKNKSGTPLMEAGPVTLGMRLSSSIFPAGYEAISYGRGTWLFHMLRGMMREGADGSQVGNKSLRKPVRARAIPDSSTDELFLRTLRKIRDEYQGKTISTQQLIKQFEDEMPRSSWYEGKRSLAWFYDGWVNGTAIPEFELKSVKYLDAHGSTIVSGFIAEKNAPADLVTSVGIYGIVAGRSVWLGQVFVDGPETRFRLSCGLGTRKVLLDPAHTILSRNHYLGQ